MNAPDTAIYTGEFPSFSPEDHASLTSLVKQVVKPGCRLCEVGSWLGTGSTQAILGVINEVPDARLLCVDTWRGNPGVDEYDQLLADHDALATFRYNIRDHADLVDVMIADSLAAAATMQSRQFDLVFLDADHRYNAIEADIAAWRYKVKRGGILCGHDCETRPSQELLPRLETWKHQDTFTIENYRFAEVHAGVVLAVHDAFEGRARLFSDEGPSTVWSIDVEPRSGVNFIPSHAPEDKEPVTDGTKPYWTAGELAWFEYRSMRNGAAMNERLWTRDQSRVEVLACDTRCRVRFADGFEAEIDQSDLLIGPQFFDPEMGPPPVV